MRPFYLIGIGAAIQFVVAYLFVKMAKKMTITPKQGVVFLGYVQSVCTALLFAICLQFFYPYFILAAVAYLLGWVARNVVNKKFFVSSAQSQQTVTIHYLTPLLKQKVLVLPVEQITSTQLSEVKGWHSYPLKYSVAFNNKVVKFHILNPIASYDFFYLADSNADTNTPAPAEA